MIIRSGRLVDIRTSVCISKSLDRFWVVHIPFVRMVKFQFLALFSVDHLAQPVVSSLSHLVWLVFVTVTFSLPTFGYEFWLLIYVFILFWNGGYGFLEKSNCAFRCFKLMLHFKLSRLLLMGFGSIFGVPYLSRKNCAQFFFFFFLVVRYLVFCYFVTQLTLCLSNVNLNLQVLSLILRVLHL